jgi:acylphosphatase
VQGVWFRDSTRKVAVQQGIRGHAINLDNGDVEVLACGTPQALAALRDWLWQGPPLASVADVREEAAAPSSATGFRIG